MNENNHLVSIVLPVYNAQSHLSACLDSLLSQTHTDIEIIAIDDASKDSSYHILQIYKKLDKRVKVFQNVKRYGISITLNRAIKHAKGHYITFMKPTDYITRDKTRKQVQYLLDNPKTVAVGTQAIYMNKNKKRVGVSCFPTDSNLIHKTIFTGFAVQNETVLINRFMLPMDLLHFLPVPNKKFSYTPLLVKVLRYGTIANLDQQLYTHIKHHDYFSSSIEFVQYIKLWFQARFVYDMRLPLQTLFYPLVR